MIETKPEEQKEENYPAERCKVCRKYLLPKDEGTAENFRCKCNE